MKILALQAENIKRLTAVEIRPDGALVQITGANGQGKTSVLDSIWWALSGAKNIQVSPIRNGATKAHIRLDLGDLIVTRKFSLKDDHTFTTTITVENADGARFRSPQEVLDKLVGALSFDPLEFTRLPAKQQLETLKALVKDVDWREIEKANAADYEARTALNREAASYKSRAATIAFPDDTPDNLLDESELISRLSSAADHNEHIAAQAAERERWREDAHQQYAFRDAKRAEAEELRNQAALLDQKADEHNAAGRRLEEQIARAPELPARIDTVEMRNRIGVAQATNAAVRLKHNRAELEQKALAAEVAAGKLTKAMRDRADDVANAIAAANLPVPGLGFGDGYVFLNGQPFDQASGAEQLRTSIALAMAMNPQLKVLRIKDGSLLDETGLRMVAEMAEAEGFQVWMERVDTSGRVGFVIEDGAVRDALPVAAE